MVKVIFITLLCAPLSHLLISKELPPVLPKEPPPVTVKLKVTDEVGAILPGATIAIQHWRYDRGSRKFTPVQDGNLRTDSRGESSVQLDPGIYDLSISSAAFLPSAQRIRVTGQTHFFNISLNFDKMLKTAGGS